MRIVAAWVLPAHKPNGVTQRLSAVVAVEAVACPLDDMVLALCPIALVGGGPVGIGNWNSIVIGAMHQQDFPFEFADFLIHVPS